MIDRAALQLHSKLAACRSVADVEAALHQVLSRELGDEHAWRTAASRLASAIWTAMNA